MKIKPSFSISLTEADDPNLYELYVDNADLLDALALEAGFTTDDDPPRSIYLECDPGAGTIKLDHGYEPESRPGRLERKIFDEYEKQALKAIRSLSPIKIRPIAA